MTDEDLMNTRPNPEFGSGVIGVCDVCGKRQAVIVLQKERFKLCVLDFLNKTWATSGKNPGAPLPAYRSERIFFPTPTDRTGRAPAIVLTPTKPVKHPVVLVVPDVYGLTTTVLDAAIRFAREGFEVLLPDVGNTAHVGPASHLSMRIGARTRGGVSAEGPRVATLLEYYRDALAALRAREMADPEKSAVFGVSFGASLAALLAAQEPKLGATVLAYPVPLRPADTLRLVTAPLLVVGGGADPVTGRFLAELRALPGVARSPEIVELAGARHDFLARDLPAYDLASAEIAWDRMLKFLKQALMPAPPRPPAPPTVRSAPAAPPASATAPASSAPDGVGKATSVPPTGSPATAPA